MSDALIEAVAKALYHDRMADLGPEWEKLNPVFVSEYTEAARAALAAIEASGTHVVAPLNANGEMVGEWRQSQASGQSIETGYHRMLAARPKVTE